MFAQSRLASKLHLISRDGTSFYGLYSRKRGEALRAVKRARDFAQIDRSSLLVSAIRYAGIIARECGFSLITIPPDSGIGESFAFEIARRVGAASGVRVERIFKDHSHGKRFTWRAKLDPIEIELSRKVEGERILLFDDFQFTGWTMVRSIRALRVGNECEGLVIC